MELSWRDRGCVAALLALCLITGCESERDDAQKKSADAPEAALEKSTQKGPVTVTLRVTPKAPRLSDLVELDLIMKAPPEVEVTPPAFGEAVGEFLVRKYNEKTSNDGADKVKTLHYQLEPAHAGKHLIRSMAFEFVDKRATSEAKGQTVRLETEPLSVEVTSELGDATPSLTDLQPMSAPKELPPKPLPAWVWVAIAAAGLSFGATLAWWQKRKARLAAMTPPKTPEELAQEAMMALLAENLPSRGLHKEFYVRLTGIVRQYIERTTGIHAPEQTTEEFLRDMRQRMIFSSERAERLAAFLEAADMVKYAGQQPGERQTEESIARAQEFVGLSSALSPLPSPSGKNPALQPRVRTS